MLLTRIILKNFRQFYGEQSVDLSQKNNATNVTVIFGANGRGKTGLYRAIMFCLYGERKLVQDGEEGKKEISLVNRVALEESVNSKKEVEACVTLEFEHNGEKHILKRSILGMICDGEEIEQVGETMLSIIGNDGNAKNIKKSDEISLRVNDILDKRVREYFLFDGEKIERLTRTTRLQKKEIEVGIKNLLNIDELFIAKKGVGICLKNMEKRLQNEASGEYRQVLLQLAEKEDRRDSLGRKIGEANNELELAQQERDDYNKKLTKFEGIKQLVKRRKELEQSQNAITAEREELLCEMVTVNDDIGLILIESEIKDVDGKLNSMVDNHSIPSLMRERLIKDILEKGICVCGRNICDKSSEYQAILEWKNKVFDQVVEDSLLDTHRRIGITREYITNHIEKVEQCLQGYSSKSQEIDMIEHELASISEEIGGQSEDGEDLLEIEKSRNLVLQKIGKIEQKCETLEGELKIVKDEIKIIVHRKNELDSKQERIKLLVKRSKLIRDVQEALQKIYEDFTGDIKKRIGYKATEILHELIDEQGRKTFKEIIVTEDYSLQLIDFRGKPFLANISAGQRQIMSISFISALAQIAGNNDLLEMPLFMDTPFGRLSSEHRNKLIRNVPDFSLQWILLATDTEFTDVEVDALKKTKRWNRIYVLDSEEPFKTNIKEVNISSFNPKNYK